MFFLTSVIEAKSANVRDGLCDLHVCRMVRSEVSYRDGIDDRGLDVR